MSEANDVQAEPVRKARQRKEARRGERAVQLRPRIDTACFLLQRALAAEPAVAKELAGAALDVLRGEGE